MEPQSLKRSNSIDTRIRLTVTICQSLRTISWDSFPRPRVTTYPWQIKKKPWRINGQTLQFSLCLSLSLSLCLSLFFVSISLSVSLPLSLSISLSVSSLSLSLSLYLFVCVCRDWKYSCSFKCITNPMIVLRTHSHTQRNKHLSLSHSLFRSISLNHLLFPSLSLRPINVC